MNSSSLKQILVVTVAMGIALYLLERAKPPQHSDATRHSACAQVGARNHSGGAPYDPFGVCPGGQKRDYAGRNLPDEGR